MNKKNEKRDNAYLGDYLKIVQIKCNPYLINRVKYEEKISYIFLYNVFMILNVFFFWLQTISPSLLTASSFQLLCRSHVVTAYDPNLSQGEVRICWMMEKKLFCYNFFGSLHKIVTDTQQWEMSIFTDTSAIFDPKSNEGLCRSRCLKHLLGKSDTQLPPTPPLPPIPYFSWARFERAAPSSPPDTLFLPPSKVS